MTSIKTKIILKIKSIVFKYASSKTFPEYGISKFLIFLYLFFIREEYTKRDQYNNLGWLTTPIRPIGVWAYKFFLDVNPNHLGNWSLKKCNPFGTQKLEKDIIEKMLDLYKADKNSHEGYITSGGTEGNLYSVWIGKKYLQKQCNNYSICILHTDLTHYSIQKCADITSTTDYIVKINPTTWSMDPNDLLTVITDLYKKGYRGFLIPLTLGYTQTGTSDDISIISKTIYQFRKKYKNAFFFLWIDAALNGLIQPFLDDKFSPFDFPFIQAFVVDFHKFGGSPYPAGIILYRKTLRKNIERSIPYLPETDTTILGSRPGTTAAAIWTNIAVLGKGGFRSIVNKQMENKDYFIKQLKFICPDAKIVTNNRSLTCAVIFPDKMIKNLPNSFCSTYGMFTKKSQLTFTNKSATICLYKFYFLNHMGKKVIDSFINNLKMYI